MDHALRHGDSLIGLSIPQLEAFHWKGDAPDFAAGFESLKGQEHLNEAAELRQLIRDADGTAGDAELRELCDAADTETNALRFLGDLAVSAFFERVDDKSRDARRKALAAEVIDGDAETHRQRIHDWRDADPPLAPFHWPIEFPEVFDRDNPGFDSIVGNPPFLGGKRISTVLGTPFRDWLGTLHVESNKNADLVAHFFRRSYDLIRRGGTLGLIATNTIAQGDTRTSGLCWIGNNGGHIYHATKRVSWPGVAAVVVSVVHISKGPHLGPTILDGQECDKITAFLFHDGGHDDPARLVENTGKSFVGSFLRGMGFTFDDRNASEETTSLSEMFELIENEPNNLEAILPYIGGEELNSSPTHAHHRYVIDFKDYPLARSQLDDQWATASESQRKQWQRTGFVPHDYPLPVASDWPELLDIVEMNVKPYRDSLGTSAIDTAHKTRWWLFANDRPQLRNAIEGLDRILANSSVSHWLQFAFLPANMVYAHTLIVYPFQTFAAFCTVQSRVHEVWARFFGSSLEERLRYTPSDCFDTFPFPTGWEALPELEAAGKAYYEFRTDLMIENDEGMTKTYNRFNNPDEQDPSIIELRELHIEMDQSMLGAYGWGDIPAECGFFLDYEIDEETWGNKKKPYRFRWPDHVRDEVLGRLLDLNAARADVEDRERQRAGGSVSTNRKERQGRSARPVQGSSTLFDGAS